MAKATKKTSDTSAAAPTSSARAGAKESKTSGKSSAVAAKKAAAAVIEEDNDEYEPAISESVLLSSKPTFDSSKLSAFHQTQYSNLLHLRDMMLDTMAGVAHDNLRKHAEDTESHAFGQHQADAGSDAYDRDFALSLLSQEQDALYEIDEAIARLEAGTYGTCEMSGKKIMKARLEAIPWARFTVECQSQIEREQKAFRPRRGGSVFGIAEEDARTEKEDLEESDS